MGHIDRRREQEALDFFQPREEKEQMPPFERACVWLGVLIIAWLLVLGIGKAVLQLCGLW